ncbi:hypothetical protein Q6670_004048 [Salmonella enterica]|nr:hypothetical protein [Salmonella enterica]
MNTQHAPGASSPFVSLELMMKATAKAENGARFIYFEASNEGVDQQGERVLAKALKASKDHFLKFGNIDLDHFTMIGAKAGIPNYQSYEVGQPVDVQFKGERTLVKARLYDGDTPLAEKANEVWESMTMLNPPAKWYPSVGGAILAKSQQVDPKTGDRVTVIDQVRWTNVALSRTPVNQHLPQATTHSIGTFTKSLNGFVLKTLDASYSTDVATLAGGGAFGVQSLDKGSPASYFDFRDLLAEALLSGLIIEQSEQGMTSYAEHQFGMASFEAADWVRRFMRNLKSNLRR